MNILITAPSLNTKKNVSGISTVVNTIVDNNYYHNYYHYLLGRSDKVNVFFYFFEFFKQLILFPFYLKKWKIDLVHQNLPFDRKGLLRESIINYWCYLFNVSVVLHIHGGEFLQEPKLNKHWSILRNNIFKNSAKVIVLSNVEKELLSNYHNYNNAEVLSNSIDVEKYKVNDRTYSAIKPTFLFLGRLHESKGLHDVYEAFVFLINKNIEFKFILCGTGPLESYCLDNFRNLLGDNFDFRGIISGKDKLAVLNEADFFLLPSRYGEGLPMALLESMASGLVPIVTDDASMKYIIVPNVNGVRVKKKNPNDLASKIELIMFDKSKVFEIQQEAYKTVNDNYNIKSYVNCLNDIYINAIK